MKRFIPLVLVFVLCVALVGCSGAEKDIDECSWEFVNAFNAFSVQGGYSIAESIKSNDKWSRGERNYLSFTATSEALGVYKKVFYITEP